MYATLGYTFTRSAADDLIQGGRPEIVIGSGDGVGHLDIYAAEMYNPGPAGRCRQWVLYGDGKGHFDTQILSTGIGSHESKLGDLDGDGRIDILQKDFQKDRRVDIWLNQGPAK